MTVIRKRHFLSLLINPNDRIGFNVSDYDNIKEIIHNMDANSVDISPDSKEISLVDSRYSRYGDNTFLLKVLDIQTGAVVDSAFYTYKGKYDDIDIAYDSTGNYLKVDIINDIYDSVVDRFVKHTINTYVFDRHTLSCVDECSEGIRRSRYGHYFEENPSIYKAVVNKGEVVIQKKEKKNTYSIDSTSILVISPDEKTITTVKYNCNIPCVWNLNTGKKLYQLVGHTDTITHISYSQDCKYIASCSADSTLKIWDAETGRCIKTIQAKSLWCEFDDSSSNLLVIGQREIFSIRTDTWKRGWTFFFNYHLLDFTDKNVIKSNDYLCLDNYIFRISDGTKVGRYGGGYEVSVNRWMAIHPAHPILYYTSTNVGNMYGSSELYVTEFLKNAETQLYYDNHSNYDIINDIDISNNGDLFVTVSAANNTINIYNTENNEKHREIQIQSNNNDALRNAKVSFDKSDRYLLYLEDDNLYIIDISSGQIIESLTGYYDFQLSSNGNYLILHDGNGKYTILTRHSLQSLINITKKLFEDNPLTPEERRKYFLE